MDSRQSNGRASKAPESVDDSEKSAAVDVFSSEALPRRFGRYMLLRLLARGGMGQIFLASTTGVEGAERPVVIKVIRREHARDPNFLARFLDEARVQSQLQHSGVAQVIEAATHESGDPYVVIEYIEGRSLGQIRRRTSDVGLRLRWTDAAAIGTLICEGLAHIHERCDAQGRPLEIVHRDLSPHNVMVSYSGDVKVIDFGTARGQNRRCHTVAGVVFAKPGYVAPEVANGDSGDFRVDMYAAGVMIWEMCAGRRFLQGESREHMGKVAAGKLDLPPIAHHVGAPEELDAVLARMTAHDRDDRFESTRIAASRLAALLTEAPALPNGERGVRARTAQLMYSLYPAQPGRCRRQFTRLVGHAREQVPEEWDSSLELPEPRAKDSSDMLPGTRYRLRREIGRGANSIVYEAEHIDLGRRVAVKVLDANQTHSLDFEARFRREARILSRIQHPSLVRIYDFGQAEDGRLFCAMELLEGVTLRDELDRFGAMEPKRALRIARQASLALFAAHRADLIHRDIKPENIFLCGQRLKLIDFGLAKSADEIAESEEKGKLGGMTIFGTPDYMAPEQIANGRGDHRADIYSLGCVLYEMLTGHLPFVADSAVQVLDAKLKGNPENPRQVAPLRGIGRSTDKLVMRALARHPARRFHDAASLSGAIALCLDEPSRRRSRRRAVGASLTAAIMAFAVVLLVGRVRPYVEQLPAQLPWLKQSVPASSPSESQPALSPDDAAPVRAAQSKSPTGEGIRLPETVLADKTR